MKQPTPAEIIKTRKDAGLTQTQAAALIYSALRTWQHWEKGDRVMHQGLFELFKIKIRRLEDGW
jgi:DNA (cytosine-5)-methyltransferase 1